MKCYPALVVRPARPDVEFADLVAAALDEFGVTAIEELDGGAAVRAFFPDSDVRDRAARALAGPMPDATCELLDVPDEDWAARSQASLRAVRVGTLTVAPPWDTPAADAPGTIVILPSTGFGTGHHATTRLCLAALQTVAVEGRRVLDVGTGSGVLAIASAMLGARQVLAIDDDQDAIDNALENLELNADAVARERIEIVRASIEDRGAVRAGQFGVVLANLTGATLTRFAADLKGACAPQGAVIVSGLREEEEWDVRGAFGCAVEARAIEDGWVALVFRT